MATVIAAYKSDGTCVGRCDARCHTAQGSKCRCICGGRNHGVGLVYAQMNIWDYWPEILQANPDLEVRRPGEQGCLFD